MPISDNYILKKIGDDYMIIPLSDNGVDFSKVYNINESAAIIFENLQRGMDMEGIINLLIHEYDVDLSQATSDCYEFVESLKKRGIYHD